MRCVAISLAALLAVTGCYASHGRFDDAPTGPGAGGPADAGGSRDAGELHHDAGELVDAGLTEEARRVLCTDQCETCTSFWGSTLSSCMRGCLLRFDVAVDRGCAADFPAWLECLKEEACEAAGCAGLRTCW